MSCSGCAERRRLLAEAREAYRRGDIAEVRRLLKEMFGFVPAFAKEPEQPS